MQNYKKNEASVSDISEGTVQICQSGGKLLHVAAPSTMNVAIMNGGLHN